MDDQGYLMPEELGIPQHVQRVLNQPGIPIQNSMTLPHFRPRISELSGSLPNEKFPFYDMQRNISTPNFEGK